jgi:hypothetical protein
MCLNDVNKLYKKLPPLQAANLAFEANVRRDNDEVIAITESQPRQYFTGTSSEYSNRFMSLTQLAFFYSAILLYRASKYDEPGVLKIATTLGSMELALIESCKGLGVDVQAVKKLGDVSMEDSFGEYADEALIAEYIEVFMCFII